MLQQESTKIRSTLTQIDLVISKGIDKSKYLRVSNSTTRQMMLGFNQKLVQLAKLLNINLREPASFTSPVPDPSDSGSQPLYIPETNNQMAQEMGLIRLQGEINARTKNPSIESLKSWNARDLGSSTGQFTSNDPFLVFSALIFDFLKDYNKRSYTQVRMIILGADPSTFSRGGLAGKLCQVCAGDQMDPDSAKKMLIIFTTQLSTKTSVQIMQVCEVYDPYLIGVVSYIRDIKLKIGGNQVPTELTPDQLYSQLAKTFDLQYQLNTEGEFRQHSFIYGGHSFIIKQRENSFTGNIVG